MAGGPNAAVAGCWRCAELANRVSEGIESDGYLCASCGYQFSIDFFSSGPPSEPLWPLTPRQKAEILTASERLGWKKDKGARKDRQKP